MWRRTIVPLTEEERDNHLFRIPDDPKRFRVLPELSHNLGERSVTQPQISTVSVNASKTDPQPSQLSAPTSFNDPSLQTSTEPSRTVTMEQSALSPPIKSPKIMQLVN